MKDFNIDGKATRVFVLAETENRVVYIPVKNLHRVDYDRMTELESNPENKDLLKAMSRSTLSNGMNCLTQFENIIQIMDIADGKGTRIKRPEELQGITDAVVTAREPVDTTSTMVDILSKLTELVADKAAPTPNVTTTAPVVRNASARSKAKPAAKAKA